MITIARAIIISLVLVLTMTGNSIASDSTSFDNSRIRYSPPNSFGLGLGHAFGGVGLSYDRAIHERVTLTAAIGDHSLAPDTTYQVGVKFFTPLGKFWQPRLTVLYGTNTLVNTSCELFCFVRHYEQFDGFSFGIGQRFIIGSKAKHSIELDYFLSIAPSEAKKLVDETDALFNNPTGQHLSIGYRYYF